MWRLCVEPLNDTGRGNEREKWGGHAFNQRELLDAAVWREIGSEEAHPGVGEVLTRAGAQPEG
jgi:hypothetical protein